MLPRLEWCRYGPRKMIPDAFFVRRPQCFLEAVPSLRARKKDLRCLEHPTVVVGVEHPARHIVAIQLIDFHRHRIECVEAFQRHLPPCRVPLLSRKDWLQCNFRTPGDGKKSGGRAWAWAD